MDPLIKFQDWFAKAQKTEEADPTAAALATASKTGFPSVRYVLWKGFEDGALLFYTNFESRKAKELDENPKASLVFYWPKLFKQVRMEGKMERASAKTSDAYWETRPRESQIGAWASPQSSSIESREDLDRRVREMEKRYENRKVPRPGFWGAYKLTPSRIEFWTGQRARLHDRELFELKDGQWTSKFLAP